MPYKQVEQKNNTIEQENFVTGLFKITKTNTSSWHEYVITKERKAQTPGTTHQNPETSVQIFKCEHPNPV